MSGVDVTIAILTFRRPDDLVNVLHDVVEHVAASRTGGSILVIDNDETPSAQQAVTGFDGVRYVHEPTPGIAAARNRAFDESSTRLLIFIDDDERPKDGWLDALVDTWSGSCPAAVVGPVISDFAGPVDPWIDAGEFFRRLRHPTGTHLPVAATNNLLLDLEAVRRWGLRFDERFGISGGSDSFFTRSLVRSGGTIVWCDEAVVVDVVPPQRLTREWVIKRARRMGNSQGRVAVLVEPPGPRRWLARARLVAKGSVRIALGGARALWGRSTRDEAHHARGARTVARGRGMISGAVGRVVVEYGRPTTSVG